jgi:hypothetical protein
VSRTLTIFFNQQYHLSAACMSTAATSDDTVFVSRDRLQQLEASELRVDLDADNVRQLNTRVAALEAALAAERTRTETQAKVLAEHARVVDKQTSDLNMQHVASFANVERAHAAVVASKDATIAEQKDKLANLERSHATIVAAMYATVQHLKAETAKLKWCLIASAAVVIAVTCVTWSQASTIAAQAATLAGADAVAASKDALSASKDAVIDGVKEALAQCEAGRRLKASWKADFASRLSAIHTAVTLSLTLEVHPLRPDQRQFITWHAGPLPPVYVFDYAWATAVCGDTGKGCNNDVGIDFDINTDMRARVTRMPRAGNLLTLRSSVPLIRLPLNTSAAVLRKRLPLYRVVVEAYPEVARGCHIGFVPSHVGGNSTHSRVSPKFGSSMMNTGGWWFIVQPEHSFAFFANPADQGWIAMTPRETASSVNVAPSDISAYATTTIVPPLPAGGAVELAVDYAAGTCRVAFYMPQAVAGGFVAAPFAAMELRFVATERAFGRIPARAVPTKDPKVHLYPALGTDDPGVVWRFV